MVKIFNKRNFKHILLAIFCASLGPLLAFFNAFYSLDNMLCDKLYQTEQLLDGRIVVLGIDTKVLMELGKFETWDRGILAEVIEILNSDPDFRSAVIDVDIMFFSETDEKNDTRQGFVNTMPDADGIIRTSMLYATLPNGQIINSFAYEIYKTYAQKYQLSNTVTPPLNNRNQW